MSTGGFNFYRDAALTAPALSLQSIHDGDDSPTSNDFQLWLGSPDPLRTLAATDGNLIVSVEDAAEGSGYEASNIKLATTQGGLAAGGQTLDTGATTLAGGVANAFAFWLRVTEDDGTPGVSTELSLALNAALVT